MKVLLEKKDVTVAAPLVAFHVEKDSTINLHKFNITTSLNVTNVIDSSDEATSIIRDMGNRHPLQVCLELSEVDQLNPKIKMSLRSAFFTKFAEKFKKKLTITGEMHFVLLDLRKVTARNIRVNFDTQEGTLGEGEQDRDIYSFKDVRVKDSPDADSDKLKINRKILKDGIDTDVTIIASNDAQIMCHKSFLIAHSSMFEGMLNSGMQEAITNVIEMKTFSEPSVRALLAYLYYWDLNEASTHSEIAVELLKAADYYGIAQLDKEISELLLKKPSEWFSVDSALDLFVLSNRLDQAQLKSAALKALQINSDELKTNGGYLELFKTYLATAMELCHAALSMKPLETDRNDNGNPGAAESSSSIRNSRGSEPGQDLLRDNFSDSLPVIAVGGTSADVLGSWTIRDPTLGRGVGRVNSRRHQDRSNGRSSPYDPTHPPQN